MSARIIKPFGLVITAALLSGMAVSSQASQMETGAQAPVSPSTPVPLRPASLLRPGETIAAGDLMAVSRAFGDWTMHCEMRLSTNRKICAIEQSVSAGNGGLVWRVTESEAGRAIVLFSVPASMHPEQGLHLSFSDLEKTIPAADWQCSDTACVAAVAFEGIWKTAIEGARTIRFSYTASQPEGDPQVVLLETGMAGFSQALQAAGENPFGQKVSVSIASVRDLPPQHLELPQTIASQSVVKPKNDTAKPELKTVGKMVCLSSLHKTSKTRAKLGSLPLHTQLENARAEPRSMEDKVHNDMLLYLAAEKHKQHFN